MEWTCAALPCIWSGYVQLCLAGKVGPVQQCQALIPLESTDASHACPSLLIPSALNEAVAAHNAPTEAPAHACIYSGWPLAVSSARAHNFPLFTHIAKAHAGAQKHCHPSSLPALVTEHDSVTQGRDTT